MSNIKPHHSLAKFLISVILIIVAFTIIYFYVPGLRQYVHGIDEKGAFRRATPPPTGPLLPDLASTSDTQALSTQPDADSECIAWAEVDSNMLGSYICAYSNYARITIPEGDIGIDDPDSDAHQHFSLRLITLNLPGNSFTDYQPVHVYLGADQVSGYTAQELLGLRCLKFWGTLENRNMATQTAILKQSILSVNELAPIQVDKVTACD